MKRAFVPIALHAELTEYTSLIRVLRTTRTLDLTTHLLQHATQPKDANEKDADTWTLWPLIDCPVPEWSLEDEIMQLSESVVTQMERACEEDDDEDALDSDSDVDLEKLSPAASRHLVFHTTAVLVHILNLLADQRPSAPGSMQNRLWAINWEDVISLLAVTRVVDPSIVARAEKRLERIYGPSSTKAMQRLSSATAAKARHTSLEAIAEDQLFAMPVVLPTQRNDDKGGEPEIKYKSREVLTDTDSDTNVEEGN